MTWADGDTEKVSGFWPLFGEPSLSLCRGLLHPWHVGSQECLEIRDRLPSEASRRETGFQLTQKRIGRMQAAQLHSSLSGSVVAWEKQVCLPNQETNLCCLEAITGKTDTHTKKQLRLMPMMLAILGCKILPITRSIASRKLQGETNFS